MKSWKTRLSMVLAMLAMVLVAAVPAVADSVEVECEADEGGVCKSDVTVESYEYEEDALLEEEEEFVEDPWTRERMANAVSSIPSVACIGGPGSLLAWFVEGLSFHKPL